MPRIYLLSFPLIISIFLGCGSSSGDDSDPAVDKELRTLISAQNLSGDPSLGRTFPSIEDPTAQLGMKLFFAKSLGGDHDSACVSCHHPLLGGGDALPLSIGVGAVKPEVLGPSRQHSTGMLTVPRNAPTTFNMAIYDRAMFWDNRVESLGKTPLANGQDRLGIRTPDSDYNTADPSAGDSLPTAQARFPVTSAAEMRGATFVAGGSNQQVREALAARLSENEAWLNEFAAVFGTTSITYDRIAHAIGEYERSQVFVNNPWRSYVGGNDAAISSSAKRGALLFFRTRSEGGVDCASCHRGDFFTDEKAWALAVPQIGEGKGDGATGTNDYGRFRETKDENDKFAFRTPTLLNLKATGPYMHTGVYSTLEEVVRHHLNPRAALELFNPATIPAANSADFDPNTREMIDTLLSRATNAISTFSAPMDISESDISDIVAFLESLTDPCTLSQSCLGQWIPDANQDPDGSQLVAQF